MAVQKIKLPVDTGTLSKNVAEIAQSEQARAFGVPLGFKPNIPDALSLVLYDIEYRHNLKPNWDKLDNQGGILRWGSRMRILWKDAVEEARKEGMKDAEKWAFEYGADLATIIAVPGTEEGQLDPMEFGIVWCPYPNGIEGASPQYLTLWRLLSLDALHSIRFDPVDYVETDDDE